MPAITSDFDDVAVCYVRAVNTAIIRILSFRTAARIIFAFVVISHKFTLHKSKIYLKRKFEKLSAARMTALALGIDNIRVTGAFTKSAAVIRIFHFRTRTARVGAMVFIFHKINLPQNAKH
jgi:hypothetical protein